MKLLQALGAWDHGKGDGRSSWPSEKPKQHSPMPSDPAHVGILYLAYVGSSSKSNQPVDTGPRRCVL